MKPSLLLIVALLFAGVSTAQVRHLPADQYPNSGKVAITIDRYNVPITLQDLIQRADLIVDGIVSSAQPPLNWNPAKPQDIATDFIVAVNEVLSGTLSPETTAILVNQIGGKMGAWEAVVPDDPLLQPGERYVFFLVLDKRNLPNSLPYTRYTVEGVWSGKAKVTNGAIAFAANNTAPLRNYPNTNLASFLADVRQNIAQLAGR